MFEKLNHLDLIWPTSIIKNMKFQGSMTDAPQRYLLSRPKSSSNQNQNSPSVSLPPSAAIRSSVSETWSTIIQCQIKFFSIFCTWMFIKETKKTRSYTRFPLASLLRVYLRHIVAKHRWDIETNADHCMLFFLIFKKLFFTISFSFSRIQLTVK
jgi:hypothetical protein